MSNEPRFVFDASVIISAAIFEGSKPNLCLKKAVLAGRVVVSPPVLAELAEVLRREKFDRYLLRQKREAFLENFLSLVDIIEPLERIALCRDPRDDKYLELALAAEATALVTGDKDLLALNPFRRTAILTPEQFLQLNA